MRREYRERFSCHRRQRKPLVSDPDMHHGTYTHVSWSMSGSLIRDGGENVPGVPRAYTTRNFTYLARGPWRQFIIKFPKYTSYPVPTIYGVCNVHFSRILTLLQRDAIVLSYDWTGYDCLKVILCLKHVTPHPIIIPWLWSVYSWWRHQMETFSALLVLCTGNSPVPVNSPHKGQWRGALMFSLICVWINGWVNNS